MQYFRVSSTLAVLGSLAVAAHAVTFSVDIVSKGTVTSGPMVNYSESVIFQTSTIALPTFTTLNYSIVNAAPPTPGSGIFANGGGDSLLFNVVLNHVSSNFGIAGDGVWTYTGGTGAYANLVGGGTFTFNINPDTKAVYSTYIGAFETVPEPATMAVFGLGLIGIAARRRRR